MVLKNKFNITNDIELAKLEEQISKTKAIELFDKNIVSNFEIGTTKGLSSIHKYLFDSIYDFAGKLREVNISKGNFRFATTIYLEEILKKIDLMPEDNFDKIIEKYVEMNIAHPFREGNGRTMRIWLDQILKTRIGKVIDWSFINKNDYLQAMERSPIKDLEIKLLLKEGLTEKVNDRLVYIKGIDASYNYEGYNVFKSEDL